MPETYILGVDPGNSGGAALISKESGLLCTSLPMPTTQKAGRTHLDPKAFIGWLRPRAPRIILAVIEDVSAMPGQGVTGMFRFGYGAGLISGLILAHDIRLLKIKPAVWKSALNLSRDKAASVAHANSLYGKNSFTMKTEGAAEASLIAHFGFIYFGKHIPT